MNLFEAVKDEITTRTAADSYGIKIRYNGMACCPFHDDKNPSMKLDKRFHCFGCQADGDVIDFTSQLFGLSFKEAAEKLASDFRIRYDRKHYRRAGPRNSMYNTGLAVSAEKAKLKVMKERKKQETFYFRVLCDYLHLLWEWKDHFAPKSVDAEWHPLFCEALQKIDYIEYLLDSLLYDSIEDRTEIISGLSKKVAEIEQILSAYRQ